MTQASPGAATLSWTPPTQNTDGSALTNLAGYRIHYGTSATTLTQSIQIANPGLTTYVIEDLSPGTYYFAVRAFTSNGGESDDLEHRIEGRAVVVSDLQSCVLRRSQDSSRAGRCEMHRPAGAFDGPSSQLCEHGVSGQLRDERRMSSRDDNCQRESARVNSISLHKGITVERRRRKASGPTGARAQDSGVAGGDFITKPRSSPSAVHSSCASPSASASSPCDDAALRAARLTRCASGVEEEEQRKLKWANPSKGGDAKPPVYWISRNSRSYDSGAAA